MDLVSNQCMEKTSNCFKSKKFVFMEKNNESQKSIMNLKSCQVKFVCFFIFSLKK